MSVKVMSYVWDGFDASGSELLVMLALADWCDDNGGSLFPSIKGVADKVRVSESQARRIIRKFETDGFISVIGNAQGGAPGMTRQYRLNVPKLRQLSLAKHTETGSTDATPSVDATPSMGARDGLHGCARRVAPMRETGSTHATRTTINHQLTTIEPPIDSRADADVVFDYWKQVMDSPKSKLDSKRTTAIKARLADGFSVDDLKEAIDGCSKTPHNMGDNDRGQKFNDIELICRNAPNVERFMNATGASPPKPKANSRPMTAAENYARQRDEGRVNDERTINGTALRIA